MHTDPRVTRLGSVLRRLSVDELPQLLNVVRGEMSLVGPRPDRTWRLQQYTSHQRRRLEMKPGITGLAQVSGRNALSWRARNELDVCYVERWSLGLDLTIIWRTIWAVVSGRGVQFVEDDSPPPPT
jgi:lipopolysaccharide/colanic/teichoic acid biosynthesis glycosyltransferase